ncbi:MAG: hypothetical protein ACREP9_13600 [Candidatus Dormibacteraceae bacterium]
MFPSQTDRLWSWYMENYENFLWGNDKLYGLVKTVDEHDPSGGPKAFPDRPHLRVLGELLNTEDLVAVAKSRQMMVSWLCMSLVLFEALHPGRRWGVLCKQFASADDLLERAWAIYENIPISLRPKATRKQGLITVLHQNNPSRIHAFSQDSDEARSKTYSGLLIDEAAFAEHLEAVITAARPTVTGGGKLWLVSTPNFKEYFHTLLSDNGRIDL